MNSKHYSGIPMLQKTHLLLLSILFLTVASVAQPFQGSLTLEITDDDGDRSTLLYTMKGPNVRMDLSGSDPDGEDKMALILNRETNQAMFLMETLRMQLEFSLEGIFDKDDEDQTSTDLGNTRLNKSGKTKTITGYECDEWVVSSDDDSDEIRLWIPKTGEFGTFMFPMTPYGGGNRPSWAADYPIENFFPFEVVNNEGKTLMRVTKVEKKTVDDGIFAVPTGFIRMNMNLFGN